MRTGILLACLTIGALTTAGCGTTDSTVAPYDTCALGDVCDGGLTCAVTVLPVSTGFTGYFCTSGCASDSDCLQLLNNYDAICVSGQCYLTCPSGSVSCPYDQSCLTFNDGSSSFDLCTP